MLNYLIYAILCSWPFLSYASYQWHGEGSVPQKTLDKYAPQKIPTQLSKEIERALDVRAPGRGLLTENGKDYYFRWRVTGSNQLWKSSQGDSFPVQLTAGNDLP